MKFSMYHVTIYKFGRETVLLNFSDTHIYFKNHWNAFYPHKLRESAFIYIEVNVVWYNSELKRRLAKSNRINAVSSFNELKNRLKIFFV